MAELALCAPEWLHTLWLQSTCSSRSVPNLGSRGLRSTARTKERGEVRGVGEDRPGERQSSEACVCEAGRQAVCRSQAGALRAHGGEKNQNPSSFHGPGRQYLWTHKREAWLVA